jgi:predicted 2-oxoglutarate/Fe(II)-dependent dioxygenase YbiX
MNQSTLFTKEECNEIINLAKPASITYTNGGYPEAENINFTNYEINNTIDNKWIFERLFNFLKSNIPEEITSEPPIIDLLKYHKNDAFQIHRDSFFDRKYALGCLLNEDFTGGELIVYDNNIGLEIEKQAGNVYFFDTKLFHEVKKIESGIRWALIVFILNKNLNKKLKSII